MTDYEREDDHEFEATLQAFRPAGPPASMQAPAELGPAPGIGSALGTGRLSLGPAAMAAMLAGLAIGFGVWFSRPAADPVPASRAEPQANAVPDERQSFLRRWEKEPRVALAAPGGDAAVVLVEFVDWLCPVSACITSAARAAADRYTATTPGAVRYVAYDFPLNADCNPAVPKTVRGHEASCVAAAAVRVTREAGRAREMIGWLARQRRELASLEPSLAIMSIQAEVTRLLGTVPSGDDYARQMEAVRRDAAIGAEIGVTAVPTLYINGVRAEYRAAEYVEWAIEAELTRAGRPAGLQ